MLRARDVMSPVVFTLAADDTAASAAETLASAGVSGAPVRGANGKVVGMASQADLTDPRRPGMGPHTAVY